MVIISHAFVFIENRKCCPFYGDSCVQICLLLLSKRAECVIGIGR